MRAFKPALIFILSLLFISFIGTADCATKGSVCLEQMNHKNAAINVKWGTELTYVYRSWGSVGYSADYQISDPQIVKLMDRKVVYLHPENIKPGMCGGDEATGKFIFKVIKPGKTTLTIRELFRGQIKKLKEFQVIANKNAIIIKIQTEKLF